MAIKNKVKVQICGSEYTITTDAPAEYLQELAAQLDADMRNLMNSSDRISLVMAAIMTALVRADEAKKIADSTDHLRAQIKDYLDDNARYRQAADNARREADQLRRELEEMQRRRASDGFSSL